MIQILQIVNVSIFETVDAENGFPAINAVHHDENITYLVFSLVHDTFLLLLSTNASR